MIDQAHSVYDIFRHNATERPGALAAVDAGRSLSHRELLHEIDRLASGLAAHGVGPGDRLAILALNSLHYLNLYGACAKIGAIACPVNWRLSPPEIVEVLNLVQPRVLAVGASHLPALEAIDPASIPLQVVLDDQAPGGTLSIEGFYADPEEREEAGSDVDAQPVQQVGVDDPFAILPTAAMAGVPRGATLTHANLLAAGEVLIEALELGPDDRHLAALPLYHITGLGLSLATLQAGGANILLQAFDPAAASQAVDEHQVTLMADFPPVLESMLAAREQLGSTWDNLRYVVGLDSPDTIRRLYAETGASFWTGFGQSETTGVISFGAVTERPGSAGKPLPGLEVRCVDGEDREVPVGAVGEIVVRGPLVFAGYWADPDASDYAARGGWHHTGDLGKFDQDGYLFYAGRRPEKELIKTGGENVYPEEVERVIRELPEIAAVCVYGIPDETWGEVVVAAIELAPQRTMTPRLLQHIPQHVAQRIASFKKPRRLAFFDPLPRTETGEIDRAEVKARGSTHMVELRTD